jgi:hypothetical protein
MTSRHVRRASSDHERGTKTIYSSAASDTVAWTTVLAIRPAYRGLVRPALNRRPVEVKRMKVGRR